MAHADATARLGLPPEVGTHLASPRVPDTNSTAARQDTTTEEVAGKESWFVTSTTSPWAGQTRFCACVTNSFTSVSAREPREDSRSCIFLMISAVSSTSSALPAIITLLPRATIFTLMEAHRIRRCSSPGPKSSAGRISDCSCIVNSNAVPHQQQVSIKNKYAAGAVAINESMISNTPPKPGTLLAESFS